jgi:hypothetical protein
MRLTAVLSRDVGLSNFVKTESENRCANSVKLIDEKSLKWIRTFVVRMWAERIWLVPINVVS